MKRALLGAAMAAVAVLMFACAGMQPASAPEDNTSPVLDRILARGELRVGMAGDLPPFTMTTRDNQLIGLDVDLAEFLAEAMNVRLHIEKIAFANLLPSLEKGSIDMILSNMTMTPDRNLRVAFAGPYFISGKGILTRRGTLLGITRLEDLNTPGLTFVAVEGSTSEVALRKGAPRANRLLAETMDQGVDMVIEGRVDGILADYPTCAVAVLRHADAGLVPVAAPLTYEPIGIAIPKGDPHLLNWLENVLDGLKKSGSMKALRKKWFTEPTWIDRLK